MSAVRTGTALEQEREARTGVASNGAAPNGNGSGSNGGGRALEVEGRAPGGNGHVPGGSGRATDTVARGGHANGAAGSGPAVSLGGPVQEAAAKAAGVPLEVEGLWKVFAPENRRVTAEDVASPERLAALEREGAVAAVRGVSFNIRPGELFVVMGLSGSGKSTLIRCLLRLVEPTAGTIRVGDDELTALNGRELTEFRRHRAAMVFQHYGLLPHRTVLDNAAFGLKLRGMGRDERYARAKEALARVGLEGWESRYPGELSGGMRQRVGIARALANDPDIMLWDEPFSGLDPLIRRELQEELLRLQKELRKTIVFVTHDLDEALRLADRIAVMRDGVFVQVATPGELLAAPANDYVRRFLNGRGAGAAAAAGGRG